MICLGIQERYTIIFPFVSSLEGNNNTDDIKMSENSKVISV